MIVLFTLPWWIQWNWLRTPLEDFASLYTGREVRIDGHLDVDLGRTTTVSVEKFSIGDAQWSDNDELMSVGRVDIGLRLASLFESHQEFSHWKVDGLEVFLKRNTEGRGNWEFGEDTETSADEQQDPKPLRLHLPLPQEIEITNARLRVVDNTRDLDTRLVIQSLKGSGGDQAPFRLDGTGQYQEATFKLGVRGDSYAVLKNPDMPYPVKVDAQFGNTSARAAGALPKVEDERVIDLNLAIQGDSLDQLYAITGVPMPSTPPYRLDGQLTQHGDRWTFQGFTGAVGDSDLEGRVAVDVGGERMKIDAELQSKVLDFDDLAPLIGVPPDTRESASAEQQVLAQAYNASPRAIPDRPLPLKRLNVADAKVKLHARRIEAPDLPIDDLFLEISLEQGRLQLKPANFGVAQGNVSVYADVDTGQHPVAWNMDTRLRELNLGQILNESGLEEAGAGSMNGDIKLKATGNTLHEVARSSSGHAHLSMAGGRISGLLMELIGADVAEAIGFLAAGDRPTNIRCIVADFEIDQGKVESRRLVFDTSDTRIDGELSSDLGEETFELKLSPKPKDASAFAARTPVNISGRFKDISVSPDYGAIGLRLGAAGLLGSALTPVAALLAFFEPGTAEDADCSPLLEDVRKNH